MPLSRFSFPTTILFGAGAIERLPDELAVRGMHRPLLVTDAGLANTAVAARVRRLIPDAPVFSAVDPNPTEKNVLEGVSFYKGHDCDSVIGLGGGSPIDAAKNTTRLPCSTIPRASATATAMLPLKLSDGRVDM